MAIDVAEIRECLENRPARSAWEEGKNEYALELFEWYVKDCKHLNDCDELSEEVTETALLNNAEDWNEYSRSGSSLIYDEDICKRLYPPSKQKAKKYGELPPSKDVTWLELQALALMQAARIVCKVANRKHKTKWL